MDSPKLLSSGTLRPWLPDLVLAAAAGGPELPAAPDARECEGAALFADIAGYTRLTKDLARHGPAGAEFAGDILNACFSHAVAEIAAHQGDVLGFAGDAVIALWHGDLRHEAVALAKSCGEAIQSKAPIGAGPRQAGRIEMRIGIGAGRTWLMRLGGHRGEWIFMAAGEPFSQMGPAARQAPVGQLMLSAEAQAAVRQERRPIPPARRFDDSALDVSVMRAFLPQVLLQRLAAGQSEWMAELRTVSIVFCTIPDLNLGAIDQRQQFHDFVAHAQQTAAKMEGTICQVTEDDKGCVIILAFGLPPLGHDDDAFRAIRAATQLDSALDDLGPAHGVGIATGPTYCGGCGPRERRGYMVVGDAVNRAARLSQQRALDVVCDEPTRNAVATRASVGDMSPYGHIESEGRTFIVKGARASAFWVPLRSSRTAPPPAFVGRSEEVQALRDCVHEFLKGGGRTSTVLLSGRPGAGKTSLAASVLHDTPRTALVLSGFGSAVEISNAYHGWRSVISELLGLDALETIEQRRDAARAAVSAAMGSDAWTSLLNGLLPFTIEENATTIQMSGQIRGRATLRLLVELLKHAGERRPLILVLDDVQWFDTSSLELVRALRQSGTSVLQILILRSEAEYSEESRTLCQDLAAEASTLTLELGAMAATDLRTLLAQSLEVTSIPDDVLSLVVRRSEGNPFFARELAYAMRESGALIVKGARCWLPEGASREFEQLLPNTVTSVLTQRLDRLSPGELMTLKVGSILGFSFSEGDLEAVHPLTEERTAIRSHLEQLAALQFTRQSLASGDWTFAHALIRDATYGLIPPSQRRRLHRAAALHLDGTNNYPILAHHWRVAEDRERWLFFLERAGHDAMRRGANREAVTFFEDALKLEDLAKRDAFRRAQWRGQLGEAWYRLGTLGKSRQYLEEALRLLGKPLPRTHAGWALRGLHESLSQCLLLASPRRLRQPRADVERSLREASRLMNIVSEQCYFSVDLNQMVVCLLSTINLAERTHAPEIASRAYGTLGYVVGLGRLHRLSRLYFDRGRRGPDADAHVNTAVGMGLYHLAFGRWQECIAALEDGKARAEAVGDTFGIGLCLNVLGDVRHLMGDLAEATRAYDDLVANARARSNAQHEVWGLSGGAETLLSQGRLAEASDRLRECAAVLPLLADRDRLSAFRHEGVKAAVLMRLEGPAVAAAAVREALRLSRLNPAPMYATYWAVSCMLETALALWKHRGIHSPSTLVREAYRAMRRFAIVFPIARSRRALLRGHERWIIGDHAAALAEWRRALALARTCQMRHEIDRANRILDNPTLYGVPLADELLAQTAGSER